MRKWKFSPFTLYAHEYSNGHSNSPYKYRNIFLENKPDVSWYAYDVTFHSKTKIEFHIYTMRNNCTGGIGELIKSFIVSGIDPKLTEEDIDERIMYLAVSLREKAIKEQEDILIRQYFNLIKKSLENKN